MAGGALPDFVTVKGYPYRILPPGDYELTLEQLMQSSLVEGPKRRPRDWNRPRRRHLVQNLIILVDQLRQVGITEIFVNGSFASDKSRPGDIDGYFACEPFFFKSGLLADQLNRRATNKIWTWSDKDRRMDATTQKRQLPMWHMYHVELFPCFGELCDIPDENNQPQTMEQAFRKTRDTHTPKGIIHLV